MVFNKSRDIPIARIGHLERFTFGFGHLPSMKDTSLVAKSTIMLKHALVCHPQGYTLTETAGF